ncbi:polyprenyl synthetase family protein [Thermopirellula anaerolimosa]
MPGFVVHASYKQIPRDRSVRDRIRRQAEVLAVDVDKEKHIGRPLIERLARELLRDLGLGHEYLGWTMVTVGSALWRPQVVRIPYERRLLLLPHCMRAADTCPAEYTPDGLTCVNCGGCRLGYLRSQAESLGYQIMIAEGSPVVMKWILSGRAEAVLGVACLNALERSLEKILMAGVPSLAVPLLVDSCHDTTGEEDCILEMIQTPYLPGVVEGRSYLPLMRAATSLFEAEELDALAPRLFPGGSPSPEYDGDFVLSNAVEVTEAIAYEYLAGGGKYYRPFLTLAGYDAVLGGSAARSGQRAAAKLPRPVKQAALAVEVFHKASLIHDDIEDGDPYRYGRPTLQAQWGVPLALNVGDFLVGLGYRLLAEVRSGTDDRIAAELTQRFSAAHLRLCAGQGAELWLQRHAGERIAVPDVLRVYALKTAPAFEVAISAGVKLAGGDDSLDEPLHRFARYLGIAFQIQNDLDDWSWQTENKQRIGGDFLAGRPTVVQAVACHVMDRSWSGITAEIGEDCVGKEALWVQRVRSRLEDAGVFAAVRRLMTRNIARAREEAETISPAELRHLLIYLTDSLFAHPITLAETLPSDSP